MFSLHIHHSKGCLAFTYITDKEPTLLEFTNSVALAMRAKQGKKGGGECSCSLLTALHWLCVPSRGKGGREV